MTLLVPLSELNTLPPDAFATALEPLFESAPPLARGLYAARPFASYATLIDTAETLAFSLPDAARVEVVNAHPRIGANPAHMSAQSAREQSAGADDPHIAAELARLNVEYEHHFGFRFVVFVNKRPRSAILELLRQRLTNPREEELRTALSEMFAIARDRLAKEV